MPTADGKRRQTLGVVHHKRSIPPSDNDAPSKPTAHAAAQQATRPPATTTTTTTTARARKSMIPRIAGAADAVSSASRTPTRPRPPASRKSLAGPLAHANRHHGQSQSSSSSSGSPKPKNRRVSAAPLAFSTNATDSSSAATTATATAATAATDPRNVKDKSYLQSAIRKMVAYLQSHGYEYAESLSAKNLMNGPSGRDFNNIMTFLLRRVDPTFNAHHVHNHNHNHNHSHNTRTDEPQAIKFEDEVAMAFKTLGYPFPISKTGIVAVGAPHTWPALIAAIDWLIDFLTIWVEEERLDWDSDDEEEEERGEGNTTTISETLQRKEKFLTFEAQEKRATQQFDKFLRKSIVAYLENDNDTCDSLEYELLEVFDRDNEKLHQFLNQLDAENERMSAEIDLLNGEASGLAEVHQKREDYAADIEKFINLIQQLTEHKADLTSKVESLHKEKTNMERQMREASTDIERLKQTIDSQELSVEDVRRMERETTRVEEQVAKHAKLLEGQNNALKEARAKFDACLDLLQETVEKYNAKARNLELIPESAKHAKGHRFEIVLDKGKAVGDVDGGLGLMGGVDVMGFVKPFVEKLGDDYDRAIANEKEKIRELKDRIENLESAKEHVAEDIEVMKERIKTTQEECIHTQQELESQISSKRRQIQLLQSKISSLDSPDEADATIQKYNRRYEELLEIQKKNRDEMRANMKAVNDEIRNAMELVKKYEEYKKEKVDEVMRYLEEKKEEVDKLRLLDS
ncbi:hypothetical protein ACHAXS_010850 [Conticribra weissflogii]